MNTVEIGHLVTLGLEKDEAEVYVALLAEGPSDPARLADLTGRRLDRVRDSFAILLDCGLVSATGPDRSCVVPVPPEAGLDLLVRRRENELQRARLATVNAFSAFRRAQASGSTEHLIEVIDADQVRDRIHQLERSVRGQILGLDSPPYYADRNANELELENLARGVRYRAVYATMALEHGDYLSDNVIPSVKAGEEARTLPEVPVKLMIFDEECAVVSPSILDADGSRSALWIGPSPLLSAVIGLFEMCWRVALPFDVRKRPSGPFLQPSERRLLALLAAGLSDEQVVRAMGVSRRTLFRYLEVLLTRTGAANRFQLALYAVRNGWI